MDFFHTKGEGVWAKSTLLKSVEKGCSLELFAHFGPYLTLFDRKISGNFPHFGGGGGGGGLGGVEKIHTFYSFFIEGFPNRYFKDTIFNRNLHVWKECSDRL